MPETKTGSRFDFLRGKAAMTVTAVLVGQIILFYAIPTKEYVPAPPPLEQFSSNVGPWVMKDEIRTDDYTRDLLKADDTVQRDYGGPSHVELFVAFFKTQRAGVTPHSPKMCLPASGWEEQSSRITTINVPGEPKPIPVNRYIVMKDEERKLVMYWFQNPHRVTANEYLSRLYLIYDSLRYRRSDEAMVRVVTEVAADRDDKQEQLAIQFIQAMYQPLKRQIWSGPFDAAVLR